MLNGDAARYRVNDMVRSGESHRASRSIAKRRASQRRALTRRIITTAAALLPIPLRH